jgi:hypothetical protein
MFDLKKSYGSLIREVPVATGTSVTKEGIGVVRTLESGNVVVDVPTGATDGVFAGFVTMDNQTISSKPVVEEATIPSTSPYSVQLSSTTPYGGSTFADQEIRVYDETATTGLSMVTAAVNVSATGKAFLSSNGVLLAHSSAAGHELTVYWRVSLTVDQAKAEFYQRSPNNEASATLGSVAVMCGQGHMYTYEYDPSYDWTSTTSHKAWVGSAGQFVGDSNSGTECGYVVQAPTSEDNSLGIAFNLNVL